MPSNLTSSKINATFSQLLHIDGGPAALEKPVYSGNGIATHLSLGTVSASFGNIHFSGNIISALSGNITLADATISNAQITGGAISGITDLAVADGGTGASTAADARTNLGLGSIATQNANNVALTGGAMSGVSVPFSDISGRKYGMFSDVTDQTGSVSAATAVKFGTNEITGAGISIDSSGGAATRIKFDVAGTYAVAPNLQLANSDTNDHDVTIWAMLNGTNIVRSATRITVPKAGDGGNAFFQIIFYVTVTAGQYVEIMWLPENVAVTLDHTAAAAGPPSIPAIPSAIVVAERIA